MNPSGNDTKVEVRPWAGIEGGVGGRGCLVGRWWPGGMGRLLWVVEGVEWVMASGLGGGRVRVGGGWVGEGEVW